MKKSISIALVIMLFLSLLAGCFVNKTQQAGTSEVQTTHSEEKKAEAKKVEKTEVSLMTSSLESWPFKEDWFIWTALEEKTNVKLNVNAVLSANYNEKLKIILASGELPDLINTAGSARKFGLQGAFINVKTILDKMPNLKSRIEQYPNVYQDSLATDGALYAFPEMGMGEANRAGWMYRDDIFKKHDLRLPTNSDEFYEVLVKLKQLYPDSYPLAFRNGVGRFLWSAPQWGAEHDVYYDESKKVWAYGPIEDNYKEMVSFFNKLYKEELIPPDWLTLDTKGWQDLMSTSKSFITFDYLTRIDGYNTPMRKEDPDYTLLYMPPFKGGANGKNVFKVTFSLSSASLAASASTKNLDAIIRLMDFMYSEEGRELTSWGKEGVTFNIVNNEKQFIDCTEMGDIRNKYGLSSPSTSMWFDFDSHMSLYSKECKDAYLQARKYDDFKDPEPPMTDEDYSTISTYGDNIIKHRDEQIAKFVLGNRNISEWNAYVEEVKKLGLDKYVNVYATAHELQLKAPK